MGANVSTLKLQGTSDLSTIARDLKSVATEAKNTSTPLKGISTSLDQSTKSATSFGSKIKSLGSNFSTSIASIGTLGGTVLNLSRQYQDLGDSQIAVDKAQLKVSKTTEATGAATDKLNGLVAKGVTSGAEYEKALLDVQQAQEAQSIATQNLTERQEDHQRAQENFWIGLVPTVTSAGTSVMAILKDMGGTKGFGGLKTVLSGLGSKASGLLSGVVGGFEGISSSSGGMIKNLSAVGPSGIQGGAGLTALGGGADVAKTSMASLGLTLAAVLAPLYAAAALIKDIPELMKFQEATKVIETVDDPLVRLKARKLQLEQLLQPLNWDPNSWAAAIKGALDPKEFANMTEELKQINIQIAQFEAKAGSASPAVAGLGTSTEQAGAAFSQGGTDASALSSYLASLGTNASSTAPPINTLASSVVDLSGTFTTITKNMETFSTSFATVTAQTDPFNASLVITAQNITAENSELALLTKSAIAGATASQNMAKRQQDLARTLNQATQSMQKQSKASQDLFGHGGGLDFSGGQPQPTRTGARMSGARNPNFRVRSDWQPARKAATGMHETVTGPTWILAGEAGRERVDIGKPGSGGGFNGTINVFVDGVLQKARYSINANSGVVK